MFILHVKYIIIIYHILMESYEWCLFVLYRINLYNLLGCNIASVHWSSVKLINAEKAGMSKTSN